MKLKDIMTTNTEIISPDATLNECAKKMKQLDIGAIPVCDGDRLLGMITDRDLVIRGLAIEKDFNQMKAKDVMSAPIIYCFEDDDVESSVRIMEVKQVRRLVVLNREKRMVGIASIGDVAAKTESEALSGEVLGKISTASRQSAA